VTSFDVHRFSSCDNCCSIRPSPSRHGSGRSHCRFISLAICRASGCTVASDVVIVVVVVLVVVGVCNRSQMRTSKCTCLIFGVNIDLDPGDKCTKGIFDRSKFKVTCDISPTICGWLLVFHLCEPLRPYFYV